MARIASSLAGMMKSSSSGSTLVSPVPTTGISSLLASVTPIRSRCGSTMKMAPGRRFILRIPPSVPWSLVISSVSLAASFLVIRSKSPFGLARLELLEQPDPLLDRHEVGQHAAEPALVDVRLVGAGRLLGDRLLGLLLRADEEDLVAAGDGLAHELEGDVEALDGLGEIDDVDAVALGEDERLHLGVPAAGLVAEVDSGLEQLPHRNGRHGARPPVGSLPPRTSSPGAGGPTWPGRHRPGRNGPRVSSTPRGAGGRLAGAADPEPGGSVARVRVRRPIEAVPVTWRGDGGATGRRARRRPGRSAAAGAARGRRPGSVPRSSSPYAAARTRARLRWSTVSSGRPKSRPARQRTSTTTSAAGGPGSTATRSSSWRPTWTFRARTVQPASARCAAASASAASPACCAGVRSGSPGRSAMGRIVAAGPYPPRIARRGGPRTRVARRSGRCRQLQRRQVERVEHRVVGHHRASARGRAARASRPTRPDPPSRSSSSWSPASVRWRARNERRWNGVRPSRRIACRCSSVA